MAIGERKSGKTARWALAAAWLFSAFSTAGAYDPGPFYVVAKSKSTRQQVQKTMEHNDWHRVNFPDARDVLVVTRSEFSDPLSGSYMSIDELEDDVNAQDNEEGARMHVYVFHIYRQAAVGKIGHFSFKVEEAQTPAQRNPHEQGHSAAS